MPKKEPYLIIIREYERTARLLRYALSDKIREHKTAKSLKPFKAAHNELLSAAVHFHSAAMDMRRMKLNRRQQAVTVSHIQSVRASIAPLAKKVMKLIDFYGYVLSPKSFSNLIYAVKRQ